MSPTQFSTVILGNVEECRTECEISDKDVAVAVVYEASNGWQVNVLRRIEVDEVEPFNLAVADAKQRLSHYVNRMGRNPPVNTSVGDLSLWLMLKDDGTALGIKINALTRRPSS